MAFVPPATFSKLEKAKAQLALDHPFVASILFRRDLQARDDIPTLGIDKRGQIYYNPKFLESLSVPQIIWGLAHECFHWMMQHFIRVGARDKQKWNIAGDAVINDTLDDAKIGERIPDTVNMPGSKDETTEDVYARLPDNPGKGSGGGKWGTGVDGDLLDEGSPMTDAEAKEIQARIKIEVAEAAQAAKMRGKLPGVLAKFASDIIASKTPWYDILERFMTDFTKGETTWTRPNRRYIGSGAYLPSVGRVSRMGKVGLLIDISGSISELEIQHYNGHMKRIIEQCMPAGVEIVYCDTQVQHEESFTADQLEDVEVKFYSGGGTDMVAGVDHFEEMGHDVEVLVVLTDGYTPFPDKPYDFPIIWCISSDVKAPEAAGQTIHFEMETQQ